MFEFCVCVCVLKCICIVLYYFCCCHHCCLIVGHRTGLRCHVPCRYIHRDACIAHTHSHMHACCLLVFKQFICLAVLTAIHIHLLIFICSSLLASVSASSNWGGEGPLAARKCSKIVAETKNGYSQVVGEGGDGGGGSTSGYVIQADSKAKQSTARQRAELRN